MECDDLRLLRERWDGGDFSGVEVLFDAAEGDEALQHVDECLGERVEREFHFIEHDDLEKRCRVSISTCRGCRFEAFWYIRK